MTTTAPPAASWDDPAMAALFPSPDDVPAQHRVDPAGNPPRFSIGSRVLAGDAGRALAVSSRVALRHGAELRDPLLGHQPGLGPAEAAMAIEAATAAWGRGGGAWPRAPLHERIAAVARFGDAVAAQADEIARLLMWEIGKPLAAARGEVDRSLDYLRETVREAEAMARTERETYTGRSAAGLHHARDVRRPVGCVLCVAPYNYPVNELCTTILPALLMGNVVIAKLPRFGALANGKLLEGAASCFPDGVLSLLPGEGREVIPALVGAADRDVLGRPVGRINMLAFIGSEGAAQAIVSRHPAPGFLDRILGLGAKNAAVVLPGTAVADVAPRLAKGSLGFNGQRCTAEKLVFAPAGAEGDALVDHLAGAVAAMKVGMPWEPGVAITPLPEEGKLPAMRAYLDDALARGARLANPDGGRGWHSLMRPAVIDGVTEGMRIWDEEQFGPIVPVARYRDLAEVEAWHVRSPFGQQAGVWGPESATRARLVAALASHVARVNVNDACQRSPDSFGFTATDKSGFGTLSLRAALQAFSRVAILQSPDPAALGREA